MKKMLEKIDWKKFRIQSKKDWTIFWIFALFICFALGSHFGHRYDNWLFQFANPYMMDLNQPHSWAELMVFLLLFAVVVEAVLFLCKKPVKAKIFVLIGALLVPMVIVAGYRIHTNLIVSSLWKMEPKSANVYYYAENDNTKRLIIRKEDLSKEEWQQLIELCSNLTPVSDEIALEQLRQWYKDTDERHMYADGIQLFFDEKWGHNYDFWLSVEDGKIYLQRGYSNSQAGIKMEITFFEDNGLIEWLEKNFQMRK